MSATAAEQDGANRLNAARDDCCNTSPRVSISAGLKSQKLATSNVRHLDVVVVGELVGDKLSVVHPGEPEVSVSDIAPEREGGQRDVGVNVTLVDDAGLLARSQFDAEETPEEGNEFPSCCLRRSPNHADDLGWRAYFEHHAEAVERHVAVAEPHEADVRAGAIFFYCYKLVVQLTVANVSGPIVREIADVWLAVLAGHVAVGDRHLLLQIFYPRSKNFSLQ